VTPRERERQIASKKARHFSLKITTGLTATLSAANEVFHPCCVSGREPVTARKNIFNPNPHNNLPGNSI
jgi:hypothetical protein